MKVNKYWLSFFVIKIFYMFFSVLIFAKMTTLGDTGRWLDGNIETSNYKLIFTSSTFFMDFWGGISSKLLGNVLGSLPFLLLAFYGIYYSVIRLKPSKKTLLAIFFLLSLPSFGIWSSIAGKEAIGVFFMGIIAGYIIDLLDRRKTIPSLMVLLAFYLMFLFKPQYSIAVLSAIVYIVLSQKLHLRGNGKLFLFVFHIALAILGFYIFRDAINELSFMMPKHFSLDAGSTRENTIWVEDYDVFYNAPYGMFIAFWGPTFQEAVNKPTQLLVFLESFIIAMFFFYFVLQRFISFLKRFKVDIFIFSLVCILLFWLFFVHYPFGALNPGSALRYRENFFAFLVVLLFFLKEWNGEQSKKRYAT